MTTVVPEEIVRCKHFQDLDGSLVCICMFCLLTAGRGKNASELHAAAEHICWQLSPEGPRNPSGASFGHDAPTPSRP
jgi:hypothetical protein